MFFLSYCFRNYHYCNRLSFISNFVPRLAEQLLDQSGTMQVRFTLALRNVLLKDRFVDEISLEWETDTTPEEVLEMSQEWITTQNFLTRRMSGVKKVGESSFTIEPLEERN